MSVDIRVLCPVRLERDGMAVKLRGQTRAVLALLALRCGTPVPADRLIEELYPAGPPRTARVVLHGHVSALRRAFGGRAASPIRTEALGYVLRVPPAQLDLLRFTTAFERADAHRRAGRCAEAAAAWREALDEWTGPPCEDLDLPGVHRLVLPLHRRYARAVEHWAEVTMDSDPAAVADLLHTEVAAHPFHERMRALLIAALDRAGRRREAITVHEQGRRQLAEELGLDPSPTLRSMYSRVLTGASQGPA